MIGFTSTLDKPVVDEVDSTDKQQHAHIVEKVPPYTSARDMILNAMIEGFEVEALCGYTWVPFRQTESLPVCCECRTIMENMS